MGLSFDIYFFAALTKKFKTVSVRQEGLYYLALCQCCDRMSVIANSALLIPSHIRLQICFHRRKPGVLELHLWGFLQCVVGALNWKIWDDRLSFSMQFLYNNNVIPASRGSHSWAAGVYLLLAWAWSSIPPCGLILGSTRVSLSESAFDYKWE